jgi:methionyl-tRNA formyltransferase
MLDAMRIVFMGSPEFALPSLQRLIDSEHEIVAVYTQPDRPVGRGRKLSPPPVKVLAQARGLEVRQPRSISKSESVEELRALRPDIGIIAAYGQILRQPVLDVPPLGVLNVHASLLPRWRGAAPIPAAILEGDAESGATIMKVQLTLDAGPMLAAVRVPIREDDTTGTLTPRIAGAGAELLMEVLPRWAAGTIEAREQDDALITYAPQLVKTDALIDWEHDTADVAARMVRAYNPWPMAYSYLDGEPLRFLSAIAVDTTSSFAPGTIRMLVGGGIGVIAAEGMLAVETVQASGGKIMSAEAFLRGHRTAVGNVLAASPS